MSRGKDKPMLVSDETSLMQRILEIRYTDIEEERRLSKQLLELSEKKQYLYGSAFANTYLLDSHLALGEYSSCDFYLLRASLLCEEHGYDDLMLVLCNCAGLYYQKLNDEQTALTYFLQGSKLAEKHGEIGMASKLYNNIGYSFGCKEDWETAAQYFDRAFKNVEPFLQGEERQNAIRYLTNLAEVYLHLENGSGAKEALELCEELNDGDAYSRIRLGYSWVTYYAMIGDRERCAERTDQLLENDLWKQDDQLLVCDIAEGLCSEMLKINDEQRARRLLELIERLAYTDSLSLQYPIQCLKMEYMERFGKVTLQAYQDYYNIVQQVTAIEDDIRAQSIRSKVQIDQVTQQHERMRREKSYLENASQLDTLTGLFNRRYFDKLVSKVALREDISSLGFIMLDVDYFKQYNDFYGHFSGDGALQTVACELTRCATEGISVSRYGGDEFVCLCVNLSDREVEDYIRQAQMGLKRASVPHERHLSSNVLTVSMGYCNEDIHCGVAPEVLLDLADQALYRVKVEGRGGFSRKRPGYTA